MVKCADNATDQAAAVGGLIGSEVVFGDDDRDTEAPSGRVRGRPRRTEVSGTGMASTVALTELHAIPGRLDDIGTGEGKHVHPVNSPGGHINPTAAAKGSVVITPAQRRGPPRNRYLRSQPAQYAAADHTPYHSFTELAVLRGSLVSPCAGDQSVLASVISLRTGMMNVVQRDRPAWELSAWGMICAGKENV